MRANDFVKKHGWDIAKKHPNDVREAVNQAPYKHSLEDFSLDLKRLVESHALVGIHGYQKSKEIVENAPSDDHFYSWTLGDSGIRDKTVNIGELRKAIADVESCQ